jgi:tRNA threonylcarbamoyladenosine modification (KEOPS) complex Cgi121 subunit
MKFYFRGQGFKIVILRIFLMLRLFRIRNYDHSKLPEDAIAVRSNIVKSGEEIALAYLLAELAFKNKKNIANKFKYEFLLWLTGKTDIKSALDISEPKGNECIVVAFKNEKIAGKQLPLKLQKKAEPLDLEKISLSRVKN